MRSRYVCARDDGLGLSLQEQHPGWWQPYCSTRGVFRHIGAAVSAWPGRFSRTSGSNHFLPDRTVWWPRATPRLGELQKQAGSHIQERASMQMADANGFPETPASFYQKFSRDFIVWGGEWLTVSLAVTCPTAWSLAPTDKPSPGPCSLFLSPR